MNTLDIMILITALILVAAGAIIVKKILNDQRDTGLILACLQQAKDRENQNFLSSSEIAEATELETEKVQKLCVGSKKVRKNLRQPDSWTLV